MSESNLKSLFGRTNFDQTPLDVPAITQWLENNHPDSCLVDNCYKKKCTPLMVAAQSNVANTFKVVNLLIEKGANVDYISGKYTPIACVITTMMDSKLAFALVKLFLEKGADPNFKGFNYLHHVACFDKHDIIGLLNSYGANNKRSHEGFPSADKYYESHPKETNFYFDQESKIPQPNQRCQIHQKTIYMLKFGNKYQEFEKQFFERRAQIEKQSEISLENAVLELEKSLLG